MQHKTEIPTRNPYNILLQAVAQEIVQGKVVTHSTSYVISGLSSITCQN